jgi:trk system potassium uptake protein TrkA
MEMYIIIVGGGKIGFYLSKALKEEGHEVLLIEKEEDKYDELADKLKDGVMHGDGTQVKVLKQAGASRADVVVAVTGDDEDNLVVCQLAKSMFFVPRTIARVSDPSKEELFEKVGVDTTINSTNIIFSIIERKVSAEDLSTLLTLKEGKVNILELRLDGASPVINKRIMNIPLPKESIIISVIRENKVIFPRGDTILKEGDVIVALTKPDEQAKLTHIFSGEEVEFEKEEIEKKIEENKKG